MTLVPRPGERPEPRHLDPDKLRLPGHARTPGLALLVLAVALAVIGVTVAGVGFFGGADRIRAVGADTSDPVPPQAQITGEVASANRYFPGNFDVVQALTIEQEPEPEKRAKPGRSDLARQVERRAREQQRPVIAEFGVAMLNILGSQHTAGGKGGFAPGTSRAYSATQMLLGRGASIIGFSEIQNDQLAVFRNNAPGYDVYPGTELGNAGVPQTLAWNTAIWERVETQVVYIPFSGQIRPQPVVRLRNLASGVEIWVMNVHNSPQGMEGERDRAEAVEIAKINELTADGTPMIVMGDFNEKEEILCRMTANTSLESTIGGGYCYPPPQGSRVDWIFATPDFTRGTYEVTRAAPVPYITDHYALFSRLSIG